MTELEMIKAFAELEGVKVELVSFDGVVCYVYGLDEIYNPLLPNTLNCAARDKYKAMPHYRRKRVMTVGGESTGYKLFDAYYNHEDNIPKAVIECILKSQGLWK